MTIVGTTALRQTLAALIVLALTLAGVGRSLAAVDAFAIDPALGPICHGSPDPSSGGKPASQDGHDCCDACVLAAPALPPDAPQIARDAPAVFPAPKPAARQWAAIPSSRHEPRQARAPPLA